jgi:hypothetical protein
MISRYSEVLASIHEYHTFILSDLTSAHWFLVLRPPALLLHVRNLDLHLSAASYEYGPYLEDGDASSNTRISQIMGVLPELFCLHRLRLSFDVWNRGLWSDVSEEALLSDLSELRVLKKVTLELPEATSKTGMDQQLDARCRPGLVVQRQPMLRYFVSSGLPPTVRRV